MSCFTDGTIVSTSFLEFEQESIWCSGPRSTTKRSPKIVASRTTESHAAELLWIDSDAQPEQDSGSSANTAALVLPPMVDTGMTGNSVKELRNTYEARAQPRVLA